MARRTVRDVLLAGGETLCAVSENALSAAAKPADASASSSGRIAVVKVFGPLLQRAFVDEFWGDAYDGYDSIQKRFAAALDSDADAVLLHIDSPGGSAAGCMEAAKRLAAMRDRAGKPVVAFADELAASAAYAIATVADAGIVVPPSGEAGSVGTIAIHATMSRALADRGVDVRVFRSGKRKAEGTPYEPLTDDAAASLQAMVDDHAQQFAALVAKARGKTTADVLALEGDCFGAKAALAAGLIDQVGSFEDAVRRAVKAAADRRKDKTKMTIHAKLGLPENATDADAEKAVDALQSDSRDLAAVVSAAGAASAADAVTKVAELAAAKTAAEGRAAELEAKLAARDVDDLVRQGREEGKLTAASEATFRESAAENIERARRDLASRPVVVDRSEAAKPEEKPRGQAWEDYSAAEKAEMRKKDPELFNALLREHRARTRTR